MTLKYNQGHRKWYEQTKLTEYCNHAEFNVYHCQKKKKTALKFLPQTNNQLVSQPTSQHNTDHYQDHIFHASQKLEIFSNSCVLEDGSKSLRLAWKCNAERKISLTQHNFFHSWVHMVNYLPYIYAKFTKRISYMTLMSMYIITTQSLNSVR